MLEQLESSPTLRLNSDPTVCTNAREEQIKITTTTLATGSREHMLVHEIQLVGHQIHESDEVHSERCKLAPHFSNFFMQRVQGNSRWRRWWDLWSLGGGLSRSCLLFPWIGELMVSRWCGRVFISIRSVGYFVNVNSRRRRRRWSRMMEVKKPVCSIMHPSDRVREHKLVDNLMIN